MAEAEGIPPTASVASVGPGIRYIGKEHCYAYSGGFAGLDSEQTLLDFTTGSGYIVATLTMTGPILMTTGGISAGFIRGYQLDFNGQTVGMYKVESGTEDMPTMIEAQILIPPFTAVVFTCVDNAIGATSFGTANITGRVYGV